MHIWDNMCEKFPDMPTTTTHLVRKARLRACINVLVAEDHAHTMCEENEGARLLARSEKTLEHQIEHARSRLVLVHTFLASGDRVNESAQPLRLAYVKKSANNQTYLENKEIFMVINNVNIEEQRRCQILVQQS